MYSVEDLLISHGYKLPKHPTSSSTPIPAPASLSRQAPSSSPPSYSKHHEILENMPGPRTVNGYERVPRVPFGNSSSGSTRQPQAYSSGCPNNNDEHRDRSQPRREGESRSQIDTHSLGESLTSDSGFCDGTRGPQPQHKDVSYWRRRGQDFTVLLDYADLRDAHGGGQGGYGRPEGPQQARGQELSTEERQRLAQERQRWAAQAQAQVQAQVQAHAQARSREREAALHQWRMVTERKCQSLGTEEWRPAVSFSRQLSQSEGERWAQEQQRLHARTPEGMVVHPRTKAKSQSLPRMLHPESLQYVEITHPSSQELYRRVNGHPLAHHEFYKAPHWPENGRPASANQLSITPKPRFTRPPRPPSYEMHQQIRGSCEVLSGRESVISHARDRTPLPISRPGDSPLDYFAQDSGPPGYIPPPSYKRAPIMGGGRRGYGEITVDYRYRGDMYQQIHVAPDGSHWITRHPASSWPDPQRDSSLLGQKQLYPLYTTQGPGGGIQYIPFDDPRIRHFSSALGGNSLTDADKIRHIRNELPSVTVSEPVSDDSAFLPPPLGPFIAAKMADDANPKSSSDNDNNRWHRDLHKETVDNFPATDQNCNNRYSKNPRPPPSPSSAFQAPLTRPSSHLGSSSDQVYAETITQVKKIAPDLGQENNRNTKRRVSETIFCLVSVPVHTPTIINKDSDQNNNETMPGLTVNMDTFAVGLRESPNVRSKSVNEMPIRQHYSNYHTSSTSSMRNYKRAPLRKDIIDAWALQAREDKEMCYAGSWPGNQYRNQETQTGSPLITVKSPEPQSPHGIQEPVQSVSDTTTDSGVGTDSNSSYGYPMTGQKDLQLSSNSAFSRLSLSSTQPSPLQQDMPSPSKVQEQGDQQPSSPRKNNSIPSESGEQVAFGQFLLKPMNRRPFDAIGELETINKEMEDTISKRPNAGKSRDDLDGLKKTSEKFKSGAHFTVSPDPGREAISLPPMHIGEPNHVKVRSESLASTVVLDSMDMKTAFSGPQVNHLPVSNEVSTLHNSGLPPSIPPHSESNGLYRQDIPVPQESLLKDVGLTVYTETPGRPGEPMQRQLSVPSPLDHKDIDQPVARESRTQLVKNSGSPEHNSQKELQQNEAERRKMAESEHVLPLKGEMSLRICRSKSEGSASPQRSPHNSRLTRERSFVFGTDNSDERYAISELLSYRNESTIADKHLENLLSQEKANSLSAEDLSNLYEVKCAKGIPENESIEQRAARILGIAVPMEALGVSDKPSEDNQDEGDTAIDEKPKSEVAETQQVQEDCEQVKEESIIVQEKEEIKETRPGEVQEEGDRQKHSSNHTDGEDNEGTEIQSLVVLDLPEFPPSKLSLSLPLSTELQLSTCSLEKKGRGGACKLIESLQDKLNSSTSSTAASLGRSTPDRMARLKELNSVARIRRLSLKGSESEEKDGERNEEGEIQEEIKEKEKGKQEESPDDHEKAHEPHETSGHPEKDVKLEEVNERTCDEEQSHREDIEEMNIEVALKAEDVGSPDSNTESKTEEPDRECELKIVKGDREKAVEPVRDRKSTAQCSRAELTQGTKGKRVPKPKQRTRLPKPPLLPKPRSVPKREITLPLSFSTKANIEEEEVLSVSDSYDPSRVERV